MATVDERVGAEMQAVLSALERERGLERALAESRTDTGDALIRLERAGARHDVCRSVWISALRAEAWRLDLEELTESKVRNRTRMARFRTKHPPEIAREFTGLSVSGQRLIAALPADRLEEFMHQGVPIVGGRSQLRKAKSWELRLAVKASRGLPPGEPIPEASLKRPERVKPSAFQQFDEALAVVRQLGRLTIEQTEQLLMMVVSLFAVVPRETRCTTRRLCESTVQVNTPQEGAEAIDKSLRSVDALWQSVDFGPGIDRFEATARACAIVSRLLFTVSRWTRGSTGPDREAG